MDVSVLTLCLSLKPILGTLHRISLVRGLGSSLNDRMLMIDTILY